MILNMDLGARVIVDSISKIHIYTNLSPEVQDQSHYIRYKLWGTVTKRVT